MRIEVDRHSSTPVSAQLVAWLTRAIERGRLPAGERLPTIRALARDLGIAPNTVAKAYRELEAAGFLEPRGRAGTFVAAVLPERPQGAERRLAESAAAFVRRAAQMGAGPREALSAVRRALAEEPR